jgi:hypothetical protein
MRLVKINVPQGKGVDVAKIAFSVGIKEVSIQKAESYSNSGEIENKEAVDIQTSTPKAKHFIDVLLESDLYNQEDYSIAVRQPRSIISGDSLRQLTKPIVDPATDIFEELWQFSHITVAFVGRVLIASCLLAYGLIHQQILIILAGLLFLPLLPLLLAIGFGAWTKQPKLSLQGATAFLLAIALLITGGVVIASVSSPPLKYNEFNPMLVGWLISLAVGIAAGLANSDDVGNRQLIGLAATAQIAIIPVWFGISIVFGFPSTTPRDEIVNRALGFGLNVLTIIVASLTTYVLLGAASRSLAKVKTE